MLQNDVTTAIRRRLDFASRISLFYYAITAVAIPICLVDLSRDLDINLTQAGSLGFVTSIQQIIVLFLAAILAARVGKIPLLRGGLFLLAAGLALFGRSQTYIVAVALLLIVGSGQALLEALLTPLVEDIHPEDPGGKMNFLHAFWPMGVLTSTLVVGELLTAGVSWRTIFAALAIGGAVIAFAYPLRSRANLPRSRADFTHMREILAEPRFWILGTALFVAGGAEGGFTYWTATYIRIEFGTLARAGAIGTAAFALGMAIGRIAASRLAARYGLRRLVIVSAAAALVASVGFLAIRSLVPLYVLSGAVGMCVATFWPSIQTYTTRVLKMDPTLVMTFLSFYGVFGFSTATFAMGAIGDRAGLNAAFGVPVVYLALLVSLMIVERRVPVRGTSGAQ